MISRVLQVGLLAGLVAGLALAVLAHFTTVPIILAAEVFEAQGAATAPALHDHAAGEQAHAPAGHDHGHGDAAAWSPADGLERTLSTSVATLVSTVGFALMLLAAMLVAGETITPATALAYAAGGFAATGLATGLGLAPELPGSAAADLVARQAWWLGTAAATAVGLWLVLKARTPAIRLAGLALIVAPHLIGAPEPVGFASTAPAELAARFASVSLAVHAAMWAVVGWSVGALWQRLARG